jgi:4-amino-4-deoxychorismate lyase
MTGVRYLVDGEAHSQVPADDRGLAYGDGLFETIAVRRGRPCLWRRHLDRLSLGCRRLGMEMPARFRLEADVLALIGNRAAGTDPADGVLKVILTRGSGARGYRPPEAAKPRSILSFTPGSPTSMAERNPGVRLILCETRLSENPSLAGIKHLNRLEQVLARREWSDPDILDGVMCDVHGHAVCGTMSNLFSWHSGRIITPALDRCGVAGTLRSLIREQALALGIAFHEGALRPADLAQGDGLFISNALLGVQPVSRFQDAQFDVDRLPWALIERVRHLAFEPETLP